MAVRLVLAFSSAMVAILAVVTVKGSRLVPHYGGRDGGRESFRWVAASAVALRALSALSVRKTIPTLRAMAGLGGTSERSSERSSVRLVSVAVPAVLRSAVEGVRAAAIRLPAPRSEGSRSRRFSSFTEVLVLRVLAVGPWR